MEDSVCHYCKTNPGHKPNNETLWNGFLDKDTNQLVCWNCQDKHYREKSRTENAGQYSEFPVPLNKLNNKGSSTMNYKAYTKEQITQLGEELCKESARIFNFLDANGYKMETKAGVKNFEKAFHLIGAYEKKEREELTCDTCKHINLCEMYRVWRNEEAVRFDFPEADFSCRHHALDNSALKKEQN